MRRPDVLIALIVIAIALQSGIAIAMLRADSRRSRDEATTVSGIRANLGQIESIGWQALGERGPDFTLESDFRRRQRDLRAAMRVPALSGGAPDASFARGVVEETQRDVARALASIRRGDGAGAQRQVTGLHGSSTLADTALESISRRLRARARHAEQRTDVGSVLSLLLAAISVCTLVAVSRRTLARKEQRFRALVERNTDLVLVVDREGVITDVGAEALRTVLGREAEDVVGRRLDELVIPEERAVVEGALHRLITDDTSETTDLTMRRDDGTEVHLEGVGRNLLDLKVVGGLVLTLRDVSDRREAERQLRHQTFHDALTGLPNRALLDDRLTQALARRRRDGAGLAMLVVDLDDFKTVNDSLGHATGDTLLRAVAKRLTTSVRGSDTTARLGGDEFALMVAHVDGRQEALDTARRVREALAEPFLLDGRQVRVGASVGVAYAVAGRYDSADLMRDADIAMSAAKAGGKGGWAVFDGSMLSAAQQRLDLREDLRGALGDGSMHLVFQPVVETGSRRVVSAEALLRWQHPLRGAVSPAVFIPLAEETGAIVEIGRWVLERACEELGRLHGVAPHLSMAVNASAVQLRRVGFVGEVRDALTAAGVAADRLVVELTESALAEDEQITDTLQGLRRLGVRVAVDDFGTGFSSLSYLQRLNVDLVKIDRSFVQAITERRRDAALVRSIVELGHSLDLRMVAEGVEDDDQLDIIRGAACDFAQGYLFARPMPVGELLELLAAPTAAAVPPAALGA